jgi:hypothetical protein
MIASSLLVRVAIFLAVHAGVVAGVLAFAWPVP